MTLMQKVVCTICYNFCHTVSGQFRASNSMHSSIDVCNSCFPMLFILILSAQTRQVFLVGIQTQNLTPEVVSEEVPDRLPA